MDFIGLAADSLLDDLAFYGPFGELFAQCLVNSLFDQMSYALKQKGYPTLKILVVEAGDQTDRGEGYYPLLKHERVSDLVCGSSA